MEAIVNKEVIVGEVEARAEEIKDKIVTVETEDVRTKTEGGAVKMEEVVEEVGHLYVEDPDGEADVTGAIKDVEDLLVMALVQSVLWLEASLEELQIPFT